MDIIKWKSPLLVYPVHHLHIKTEQNNTNISLMPRMYFPETPLNFVQGFHGDVTTTEMYSVLDSKSVGYTATSYPW
jgi:protocatechuate 3,4-dioxygenase beta subunit